MSSVSGELESPVQCTEERKHDSSISHLEVECLVEESDGDAGIHVRYDTLYTCVSISGRETKSNNIPDVARPA